MTFVEIFSMLASDQCGQLFETQNYSAISVNQK